MIWELIMILIRQKRVEESQCLFYDRISYVMNDITKLFKVKVLKYSERVCEIFELDNYLSVSIDKGEELDNSKWQGHYKRFS